MKRLVSICCFLFTTILSVAQSSNKFNKQYSLLYSLPSNATSIMPSNSGYVIYGSTSDSSQYSGLRVALTKLDSAGNLKWTKSYGKKGYDYESIFTLGGGGASVPWGGYIGAGYVDTVTGAWDRMALFRFDSNGDTLWTKQYRDSANLLGWFVKVARKSDYIIGGTWVNYAKTDYGYQIVLTKTDSLGNRLWFKTYTAAAGRYRMIEGMDTCRDGGYIISAKDNDTANYICGDREAIMKIDSLGNLQWTKIITDPFCDALFGGITSLIVGGYLVCGAQNTKPYNHPFTDPSPVLFMEKLNDAGNMVWSKTYGTPLIYEGFAVLMSVHELANGDIIACGNGDSTINGCILKTDSLGNQKWLRYYNLPVSNSYYLNDIKPTTDGGCIAVGFTGNPENTWVVKTDSLGCADSTGCVYTGVQEFQKTTDEVKLYPNPSSGNVTIAITSTSEHPIIYFYNLLGQEVETVKLNSTETIINNGTLQNGIYFYRVMNDSGIMDSGKLIIQK